MNDQWAVPLTFFNLYLTFSISTSDKSPNFSCPVFKGPTIKGIDLWFVYSATSNVDVYILYELIDFIKEREIHYDMENKTSTRLNEKYKPTIILDESDLLYIKLKFEPIIGELSVSSL